MSVELLVGVLPDAAGVQDDDIGGDRDFDRIAGDLFREDLQLSCSRARLERIVAWADEQAHRLSASGLALLSHLRALASHRYTFERVTSVGALEPQPLADHSYIYQSAA